MHHDARPASRAAVQAPFVAAAVRRAAAKNAAARSEGRAGSRRTRSCVALGERVRLLRARRGLTSKGVALASGVSERHLANLEYGVGNASILVLQQVATALDCALAELVGDVTTSSPEWLMLRELLQGRGDADLRRARAALARLFGGGQPIRRAAAASR